MDLSSEEYLWKEEKEKWVLVKDEEFNEYSIINRVEKMMLLIEDEKIAKVIVDEMIKQGNLMFDSIQEAYDSVK